MKSLIFLLLIAMPITFFAQAPPAEPPIGQGVSRELARWRAAHYSDVRYKLNLTLEKMSPVLKGTMEIHVNVGTRTPSSATPASAGETVPIVLDWRRLKGFEERSTISNVSINGLDVLSRPIILYVGPPRHFYDERDEHLIFRDGVVAGENVIKLDFTSPILPSGSAITRYIDKEDGSEYIYSLFVPSDASTAFPVFDQPDLKARFTLSTVTPREWEVVTNGLRFGWSEGAVKRAPFGTTKPISTYVFAFAAGPFQHVSGAYVRKSQVEKYKPHAEEVYRLNRAAIKFFEEYFDYKFPFPKYDLVLIPEFPFGGMEHAGATFLRESSIIFPQEPTKNDHISRALLLFHEASHQWFGDTVTMGWFDDLWLKEGFATFTAYKAMEQIMPEANAWKVFYERVKQAAYRTDSTRGTTPIYQEINNLSAAKSAYGAIVYSKAPAFLRQAEFYLGEDKFQTAVRAFLKKHEFGNAGWEDLVKEFGLASNKDLTDWAEAWVKQKGAPLVRTTRRENNGINYGYDIIHRDILRQSSTWDLKFKLLESFNNGTQDVSDVEMGISFTVERSHENRRTGFILPNYQDYGYGIFLLDDKSRDYVLKNIQNEKGSFLRSMMWGALWDSVREGELDPKQYIELAIKNLPTESDETIISSVLGRASNALDYYVSDNTLNELVPQFENALIERLTRAETLGQRITVYRALLNVATTDNGRYVLRAMLKASMERHGNVGPKPLAPGLYSRDDVERILRFEEMLRKLPLKTKDKFDIVTRLLILGDSDAEKLLAELEKTETSDDAKRYAYAARAGIATADNKAKYWKDFTENKELSESWIEAAFVPWNSIRHSELTLPYLGRALKELPNHKRNRKIFFVNGWLGAFIGGHRSEKALEIINRFLADNPNLDNDLRLKILENADLIERAVKIREKFGNR